MASMPVELATLKNAQCDEVDAYERLLRDAMRADPMLLAREDAVEASWAVAEHLLGNVTPAHINVTPAHIYEPGS